MRKRGETGRLTGVVVFSVLAVLVLIIVAAFIVSKKNGASYYEEFYSQELALMIDTLPKGSEIYLDVTEATRVALKNDMNLESDKLFSFDNENNIVIVKLRKNGYTSFNYFSDKVVADDKLELLPDGRRGNFLHFYIK